MLNAKNERVLGENMTLEEFIATVNAVDFPYQRRGQKFYHLLYVFDPSLCNKLPKDLDPFYRDERLPQFYNWLKDNWNEQAEHWESASKSNWAHLLIEGLHKT